MNLRFWSARRKQPVLLEPPTVFEEKPIDNGPATLCALLRGFGVRASLEKMRRLLKPNPDGTSIDDIERVAQSFKLPVFQQMLPPEHLARPLSAENNLPAIVIVGKKAHLSRFALAWRTRDQEVQLIDSMNGANWLPVDRFSRSLLSHEENVPSAGWQQIVEGPRFRTAIQERISLLKGSEELQRSLLRSVLESPATNALEILDAALRSVENEQWRPPTLESVVTMVQGALYASNPVEVIPQRYWSTRRHASSADQIAFRGTVFVGR